MRPIDIAWAMPQSDLNPPGTRSAAGLFDSPGNTFLPKEVEI